MRKFSCSEVDIPHAKFLELRYAGKVGLGMAHQDVVTITNNSQYGPKTTANAAFKFWNFIITAGFFYSLYLAFTVAWWWFIIGLFGCGVVTKANRKGHAENYIDAAMTDEDFYERLVRLNVWLYQMNEEDAAPFYRK
jgi:hypothetical protein